MSEKLKAGIIGCGRAHRQAGATGAGMAHSHARAYVADDRVELTCVADIVEENAQVFAEQHGARRTYLDYHEMLAQEKPDIVSICTWPHLHSQMVIDCARAGVPAIHCEKPMAPTWGEAKAMHQAAIDAGSQLTFNHQRRFLASFRLARRLKREGAIGKLKRVEGSCANMIDWGTHWLDMFHFMNEETPASWVFGQIDGRESRQVFGLPLDSQGLCEVKFENGVRGLLFTGYESDIGCDIRLTGTEGIIELHNRAPHVRIYAGGEVGWRGVPSQEGLHGSDAIARGISNLVACLKSGEEPELSSHKALRTTEVIFATYESSRRRGRVELPLTVDDSAFLTMLEDGIFGAPAK